MLPSPPDIVETAHASYRRWPKILILHARHPKITPVGSSSRDASPEEDRFGSNQSRWGFRRRPIRQAAVIARFEHHAALRPVWLMMERSDAPAIAGVVETPARKRMPRVFSRLSNRSVILFGTGPSFLTKSGLDFRSEPEKGPS